MTTTVKLEVEIETGLTNNAVESLVAGHFNEENIVSVEAYQTEAQQ